MTRCVRRACADTQSMRSQILGWEVLVQMRLLLLSM